MSALFDLPGLNVGRVVRLEGDESRLAHRRGVIVEVGHWYGPRLGAQDQALVMWARSRARRTLSRRRQRQQSVHYLYTLA